MVNQRLESFWTPDNWRLLHMHAPNRRIQNSEPDYDGQHQQRAYGQGNRPAIQFCHYAQGQSAKVVKGRAYQHHAHYSASHGWRGGQLKHCRHD